MITASHKRLALAAAALFLVLSRGASARDQLLFGGPIYTGTEHGAIVEAVVIRGPSIAYVGTLAGARKQFPHAVALDLRGATAYPGFIDAHTHLTELGLSEMRFNLEGIPSIRAAMSQLSQWTAAHPGKDWILGGNWIETHWPEKRFLSREDLDGAVKDRPVYLDRIDGHAAVANSAALAAAGIHRDTPDPSGGKILRDAAGEPTGVLIDNAMELMQSAVPPISKEARSEALSRAVALYASRGWTGGHLMSATAADIATLEAMASARHLPIRIDAFMTAEDATTVLKSGPTQDATGLVRVRGVKLFADGALGSRGAALLAPYSDMPGDGLLVMAREQMMPYLRKALASRAQVATHAIGDRGNRLTLDGYDQAFASDPNHGRDRRWRIEHAQVVAPQDQARFAQLGVIASMQPSHAISDLFFAPARLGPDRVKMAYAWRDLLDHGAVIAAGSDAPVERGEPLVEFYAAIYRHDLKGFAGPDWHLEQTVSRPEALRMLTAAPAYAVFRERELGTLEVGKRADISVFSIDLMTAPFASVPQAHAVLAMVDGKVVYRLDEARLK